MVKKCENDQEVYGTGMAGRREKHTLPDGITMMPDNDKGMENSKTSLCQQDQRRDKM